MNRHISALIALLVCLSIFLTGCSIKEDKKTSDSTADSFTQSIESTQQEFETQSENGESEEFSSDSTEPSENENEQTMAPVKRPEKVPTPIVTVPETIPAPVEKNVDSFKWNPEGVYEVGTGKNMLVPGEYYILKTSSAKASVSIVNKKIGRYVDYSYLITLNAGDTVYLNGCKIINTASAHPHADASGKYQPGIYKIGRDIKAGEYIVRQNGSYGRFDLVTSTVMNGDVDDLKGRVKNFSYVTLKEGGYLYIDRCTFEKSTSKPVYDRGTSENYITGMYKVGKDIPAGNYKLRPANKANASYSIFSNSYYPRTGIIVNNKTISQYRPQTVELKAGEYIFIDNAIMTPAPTQGL